MSGFKFDEMERMLSEGRLFPIYLIYGPEQYLVRVLVDKLCEVYRAETGADVERYAARSMDVVAMIDGLKTFPMWARGKLVVVTEASQLTASAVDLLADYIKSPSSASVLVLTSSSFDGRSRISRLVSEHGAVVEIKNVYERDIPFWISREVKKKGYNISQRAASFVTEMVGTDLAAMAEAVERVILFVGKKRTIDMEDVEKVLSQTSQRSVFELTSAVGSRDLLRAEARLSNLMRNNEGAPAIVSMLARHWRLLLRAKELAGGRGVSERDLASKLRVHPFFVKEYIMQAKGFTKERLFEGFEALWHADVEIKSSPLPKEAILHKLLIDLVGAGLTS